MTITLSIIGALVIGVAGLLFAQNQKPKITLGLENGQLREIPDTPNCISTQTSQSEKLIEALPLKSSVEASKAAMLKAFDAYGSIEIIEEKDNYIYAVATSGKMKFHDDIEIYFDEESGLVQFRSASRAGKSDLGLNKERYDALAEVYNQ